MGDVAVTGKTVASALTPFIGREREIAELTELLGTRRLVTLTGPGGIGKTRLALEVTSRRGGDVALVEFAELSDRALVVAAVARALGIEGADDTGVLVARLAGRDVCMVFDGCEHVIDVCAQLAVEVLGACPEVRILATSRRPLGTTAETTYRVPPLSLPEEVESAAGSEAVALFVERATRARPGFGLTDANAGWVTAICTRLDGLPLGLELAAARLRAFGVEEIASQLDDRLSFLSGGEITGPPRQRTLRSLLDSSFDLLTEDQRTLFRRLGVFSSGASIAAIVDVCSDVRLPGARIPGLVSDLVDHSLLVPRERDGRTRLLMLDTIGEYARDRLAATDEGPWLADRHLRWFSRWASEIRSQRFTSEQAADMRLLSDELANLRRALDHAWQQAPEDGLRLAVDLEILWLVGGHLTEGRERLDSLLQRAGDIPASLRRSALRVSGRLFLVGGHPDVAGQRLERALELSGRGADRRETAELFQLTGQVLEAQGRVEEARDAATQALVLLREHVDVAGVDADSANRLRWTLGTLGDAARDAGDRERAHALYEEALRLTLDFPDRHDEAMFSCSLAQLAIDRGEWVVARSLIDRATEVQTELFDRNCLARSFELRSELELAQGDREWRTHLLEALRLRVELNQAREVVAVLERFADGLGTTDPMRTAMLRETAQRIRTSPADRRHLDEAVRVASADGPGTPVVSTSGTTTGSGRFVREGQLWTVEYDGKLIRVRDTKGMRYLATLLARPWQDVHVLELASAPAGPTRPSHHGGRTLAGSAGEILDDQARRAYRRRIQELDDELDEAERFSDDERAARARAERDMLIDELSAAFGLTGRPRKAADPAERARKAVFNRIRAAITTLTAEHPQLGSHLQRAIHTGLFCSYCPDHPTVWQT